MKRPHRPTETSLTLSEADRAALIWALEVGRALLLGDPDVRILLADPPVSAYRLDELADRVVLLGNCS